MKFIYKEFLDVAWKWSQYCSNKWYRSSAEFYKKYTNNNKDLVPEFWGTKKKETVPIKKKEETVTKVTW